MTNDARDTDVAATMRSMNDAWLGGRLDDLAARVHPDVVMVLPGFAGRVQGRDALLAGFRDFCDNARVHAFHERETQIDVTGRTAVVSVAYEMVYERAAAKYHATGRDMWVFEHHPEGWIAVWRAMLDMHESAASG
jgi:hypothetical protein